MRISWLSGIYSKKYYIFVICKLHYSLYIIKYTVSVCVHALFSGHLALT